MSPAWPWSQAATCVVGIGASNANARIFVGDLVASAAAAAATLLAGRVP